MKEHERAAFGFSTVSAFLMREKLMRRTARTSTERRMITSANTSEKILLPPKVIVERPSATYVAGRTALIFS